MVEQQPESCTVIGGTNGQIDNLVVIKPLVWQRTMFPNMISLAIGHHVVLHSVTIAKMNQRLLDSRSCVEFFPLGVDLENRLRPTFQQHELHHDAASIITKSSTQHDHRAAS